VEGLGEWFDLEFAAPIDPAAARQRLQGELSAELTLLSVIEVPVAAPSLAQQIRAAHWRITLLPTDPAAVRSPEDWSSAMASLLAADELLWNDTDKKGRPRQRDCRPYLSDLRPATLAADGMEASIPPAQVLDLEARVDPQGRSLRPEHLCHWLGERLGQPLVLGAVQRRSLRLDPC
jgi:radical SAM-linked protein